MKKGGTGKRTKGSKSQTCLKKKRITPFRLGGPKKGSRKGGFSGVGKGEHVRSVIAQKKHNHH